MDAQKTVFAAVNVDGVKSTETELSEPCNPEDTTIKIKDGTKWQQRAPSTIAFSIDDSGKYLDYPNFNTLTVQIAKIEKTPDGYDVQLKGKCGKTFPAGTKIRQHLLSGAFLYLTSGQELNQEWKQFSYIINGQAPSGVVSGSWWPRTAFARLIIPNKKAGIIEFKNIIIEETSK